MKRSRLFSRTCIALMISAALSIPSSALSATIYVGFGQTYETIQEGVDAAGVGDTVIVKDGLYSENVTINKRLTLQSENGYDWVELTAASSGNAITVTADGVTISDLTVSDAHGADAAGICLDHADNCSINNNQITGNDPNGIYLDTSHSNIILNNIVYVNGSFNIRLTGSSYNIIRNNACYEDDWDPNKPGPEGTSIFIDANSTYNAMENNEISYSNEGLKIQESDYNIVDENTFDSTDLCNRGIFIKNSSYNIVKHNDVYAYDFAVILDYYSEDNYVFYNPVIGATDGYGMWISEYSSDNSIYLNWIYGGTQPVMSTESHNFWWSPTLLWFHYGTAFDNRRRTYAGNWYSDHTLTDSNGDGITDSKYDLPGGEPNDQYPLAGDWEDYDHNISCWDDTTIPVGQTLTALESVTIADAPGYTGKLTIEGSLIVGGV